MPRPKEFDPDVALQKAVNVFWRLGYEQTSIEILMREMKISRQSLYDTFGDKPSIYFQAMAHYRETTNNSLRKLFAKQRSVKKAFAKLFHGMATETKAQHHRGCLLMNTNLSRPANDGKIHAFLRENQEEVEAIFANAFTEAIDRGEIDARKNPTALAKFFVATIQGMRALARLNHNRKELEQIASIALDTLE